MKTCKALLLLMVFFGIQVSLKANTLPLPLPFGAEAPNFTLTDLDGNTHTLYDYLDAGKTVMIDFSATWCGPCWNYHQTHILADLYDQYGPDGTDDIMVFFIEADPSTPVSSLYGGSGSQGNWVTGTPYPIMDDTNGSVSNSFAIGYFPTLYAICPNRKTYEVGQVPLSGWENWINSCSLDATAISQDLSCANNADGFIDATATGGLGNITYHWSNGQGTQDIYNLPAGTYSCTLTEGQGHKFELGPISISSPPPISIASSTVTDASCFNSPDGSISIQASGGAPGYSYQWSNGATGSTISNLMAGSYSVQVMDGNACLYTTSFAVQQPPPLTSSAITIEENCGNADGSIVLQPQGGTFPYSYDFGNGPSGSPIATDLTAGTYDVEIIDAHDCAFNLSIELAENPGPIADAGADSQLDCTNTDLTLDGTASDSGASISYQWSTTDGIIESGDDTTQPLVSAAGTYQLEVTDQANGCISLSTVVVTEDVAPPPADAGADASIDCIHVTAILDGSGSAQGPNITYSWSTTDGNILAGADGLNPEVDAGGTYLLEVTDLNNGCSATSEVLVEDIQNEPFADAGPNQQITCDQQIVLLDGSASEAGANITYLWSTLDGVLLGDEHAPQIECNAPATYIFEVTDNNTGCTSTATVEVTEDVAVPVADAGPEAQLDCNHPTLMLDGSGSDSGSDFIYIWSTVDGNIIAGDDTSTPEVDLPGTYVLDVINIENGCISTDAVTVEEVLPVQAEIEAQTNLVCAGDNNGSATILATEGSMPYTYEWPNGGTEAMQTDLAAGIYEVIVSDADDCSFTLEVEITEPPVLEANAVASNETSAGANDGTASASPQGGTGTYTYEWNTGATTADIDQLAPGSYTVSVTDENGCVDIQTVTVGEFSCTISAQTSELPVSCAGGTDGVASLDLSNATEPLTIEWSSGGTEAIETDLAAGTYTVSVLDANNCPTTATVTITEPEPVISEILSSTDASCFETADGAAEVQASGGTGTFTYTWSNGGEGAAQSNLAAGVYVVVATDANNCSQEIEVEILQPDPILASANISGETANEAGDASIEVSPEGGTGPYSYLWNTGATEPLLENLSPGSYEVEITDANACTHTEAYTIDPFDCGIIELSSASEAVSCFGAEDGVAMVDVSGGEGPFTYEWFDGSTSETLAGLPSGEYSVVVIDANNCPVEGVALVEAPDPLSLNVAEQVNIECPGQVSGSATVEAFGGTAGYSFEWEDGQTGPTAGNLPAGVITVMAVDANGCESLLEVEILEGADQTAPVLDVLSSFVLPLNNQGLATLTVAMLDNGTYDNCSLAGMQISQEMFDCSSIGVQEIEFTATDESGNVSSQIVVVEVLDQLPPQMQCPQNIVSTFCGEPVFYEPFATDNCEVEIILTDGLASGSIFPEGETTVSLQAVDPSGNENTCAFTVTINNTLEGEVDVTGSCEDTAEGTAMAQVTGGQPTYEYLWDDGTTGPLLENAAAGVYEVAVTDAGGCTLTLTAEVEEYPGPAYDVVEVLPENNGNANGAIDVSPLDGTAPYTFYWTDTDGNFIADTEDLEGLSSGVYLLEITDANGCVINTDPFVIDNVTSTHSISENASMTLVPNPADDYCLVELEMESIKEARIQLMDITGKLVWQADSAASAEHQWELPLADLPAGLYLVHIQAEGAVLTEKLIVE
ncbi:MAG: T9SS type A sorting domain-containing protein [Bacteroidetes bacterium]|nr:T9SS type A sorting domain-containing protein [Bacteroidota bacterium]